MKITQKKSENANRLTITDKTDIFNILLTADVFKGGSEKEVATALVYTEAIHTGAGKYSKEAFVSALKLLGGSISTSYAHGYLTFEVAGLVKYETKIHKLFTELLSEPHFAASEVSIVKKLKVNQLELEKENARLAAQHLFLNTMYAPGTRNFTHDTDKIIAAVKKVTSKNLHALHREVMSSFWHVSTGGSTATSTLGDNLLKLQTQVVTKAVPPTVSTQQKRSVYATSIPSKQNIEFSIGGALSVTKTHPDYPALLFGIGVLGMWGGFTGRLMSTVRELEGLTYMIYAQLAGATVQDEGYWRIATYFSPEQTKRGLDATLREVKLMVEKGISKRELERFKNIYHTRFILAADSLTSNLTRYHHNMVSGSNIADLEHLQEALSALTQRSVNDALARHIDLNTLQICAAGPIKKLPTTLDKLL